MQANSICCRANFLGQIEICQIWLAVNFLVEI